MFDRFQSYELIIKNKRVGIMSTIGLLICMVVTTAIIISANSKNTQPVVNTETVAPTEIELTLSHKYCGVSLTLPDGFYTSGKGEYGLAKNKKSQDYVLFATLEATSVDRLDDEAVKDFLKTSGGETVNELNAVKTYEIDGCTALNYSATFQTALEHDEITGCFILLSDKTVAIVFHEYSDRYSDAFARCFNTIRVEESQSASNS